jgi:hypothetical protein
MRTTNHTPSIPGLYPCDDDRPEAILEAKIARVERHRARTMTQDRWLREVNCALRNNLRDLTEAERHRVEVELKTPATELQSLVARAYAERWRPYDIAGRVLFVMLARRGPAVAAQEPAQEPDADSDTYCAVI